MIRRAAISAALLASMIGLHQWHTLRYERLQATLQDASDSLTTCRARIETFDTKRGLSDEIENMSVDDLRNRASEWVQ